MWYLQICIKISGWRFSLWQLRWETAFTRLLVRRAVCACGGKDNKLSALSPHMKLNQTSEPSAVCLLTSPWEITVWKTLTFPKLFMSLFYPKQFTVHSRYGLSICAILENQTLDLYKKMFVVDKCLHLDILASAVDR